MRPYIVPKTFDLARLLDSNNRELFDSNNRPLYVQSASPSLPTNNGVGFLGDTLSCRVHYELNGQDELTMTYPVSGELFDQIELRAVLMAEVGRRGVQPYRIYRITKPINGIVTIYARHLAYDLAGIVVEPFTAPDIVSALRGLKTHAMTANPFTFTTSRSTSVEWKVKTPDNIWGLMAGQEGSLLDTYGGEYSFDGYTVRLENEVGADNGVSVVYGVNMTDLEQDANCADCFTGVVAYWQDEESGDLLYTPVISASGNYGYVKILSVDMSDRWESKPTMTQLTAAASTYITRNKIGIPRVSWKVNYIPLDITEEYKDIAALERVSMGDTVTVQFPKLGVDASARVRAIDWNVLLDRYDSVELGDVKSNIADTIAKQTEELSKVPTTKQIQDLATKISTTLTNTILGADGGSVRLLDTNDDGEPDTLYIADNPDPTQAVKVWRFNYEGWAASQNGYNGPFTLGATLNDGLLATFVTAANLTAGIIRSHGNTFYLNLDTGVLAIGGYASTADLNDAVAGINDDISGLSSDIQEVAGDATASEQLIYRSKPSGTSSVTAPTSWITNMSGSQDTWTVKRPAYDSDYPVLFLATQRKTVSGTVSCTTPLVDDTTTVIDGGHITTGSIDAGRITTGTMTANRIRGGTMRIGGINDQDGVIDVFNANGDFCGKLYSGGLWVGGYEDGTINTWLHSSGISVRYNVLRDGVPSNVVIADTRKASGTTQHGVFALHTVDAANNDPIGFVAHGDGHLYIARSSSGYRVSIDGNNGQLLMKSDDGASRVVVQDDGTLKIKTAASYTSDNIVLDGANKKIALNPGNSFDSIVLDGDNRKITLNASQLHDAMTIEIVNYGGKITLRNASGTDNIIIDGSTGRIDCKSLYINGQQVTP